MYRIIFIILLTNICLQPTWSRSTHYLLENTVFTNRSFFHHDSMISNSCLDIEKTKSIEDIPVLIIKYAILLDTAIENITNYALYEFIDQWMGVSYQYGGNDHLGIDCSSFSGRLFSDLYGITLPRTSRDQYLYANPVADEDISEGDLLFFNTSGKSISHVGVYLGNRKFVHASTTKGVTIDDLDYAYYKKTYFGAGRPIKL